MTSILKGGVNYFRGIIATFIVFLTVLFPNNKALMAIHQEIYNSPQQYVNAILPAFEKQNVDYLKDIMCENIHKNVSNLEKKIQKMYSFIDEEIDYSSYEFGEEYSFSKIQGKIHQRDILIDFKTMTQTYRVVVVWEDVNNMKPEETQIRAIYLYAPVPNNSGKTSTEKYYEIVATDGIHSWHD